ncbi:hypothetical protein JB92DRAFT_3102059 [Gautieria morchelliformis]|nr:hypothetical protein JB92DRAFT_3102059 [Gautieria morchelliformis]
MSGKSHTLRLFLILAFEVAIKTLTDYRDVKDEATHKPGNHKPPDGLNNPKYILHRVIVAAAAQPIHLLYADGQQNPDSPSAAIEAEQLKAEDTMDRRRPILSMYCRQVGGHQINL